MTKELAQLIKGRECIRCHSEPRIVWLGGLTGEKAYGLRCNCWPTAPNLYRPPKYEATRKGELMGQEMDRLIEEQETQALVKGHPFAPVVVPAAPLAPSTPMTIAEFDSQLKLYRHVIAQMVEGVHYGVIPGTRGKSLWEPGAEYLRAAFRIAWDFRVIEEREDFKRGEYFYRVRAFLVNGGAAWEASAWSAEKRFQGRMAPEELPHNVRDRAIKRAFVALIRNVTGASGEFQAALDVAEPPPVTTAVTTAGPEEAAVPGMLAASCPLHGQAWREGKYGLYHPMPAGQELCSQSKVLKAQVEAAGKAVGLSAEQVGGFVKERFGGRTWSKLTAEEQASVPALLKEGPSAPHPSRDTVQTPKAPVAGKQEALREDTYLGAGGFQDALTAAGISDQQVYELLGMTPNEYLDEHPELGPMYQGLLEHIKARLGWR